MEIHIKEVLILLTGISACYWWYRKEQYKLVKKLIVLMGVWLLLIPGFYYIAEITDMVIFGVLCAVAVFGSPILLLLIFVIKRKLQTVDEEKNTEQ